MRKLIYLFITTIMVSGCAMTKSQVTAPNRANLMKLSIGMTKENVLKVMGTKPGVICPFVGPFTGIAMRHTINNPYRSEILQGKDKTFEVLYYATDDKNNTLAITDDELTPLVFDDSKLIGRGWSFLDQNLQRYEIRLR